MLSLDKKSLQVLKTLSAPAGQFKAVMAVMGVMDVVTALLGERNPSWDRSQALLSDPDCMKKVAQLVPHKVPVAYMRRARKLGRGLFTPEMAE